MKYLLLIYQNPGSRDVWESFSDAQREEGLRAYAALNEELEASDELIVAEALAESTQAKTVSVQDDQIMTSDGPFAEVKEQLAGFYLVEAETMDRAIAIAAQIPEVAAGASRVEVRPVMTYSGLET